MHDTNNPDCAWNYPLPAVKGVKCNCPSLPDERQVTIELLSNRQSGKVLRAIGNVLPSPKEKE